MEDQTIEKRMDRMEAAITELSVGVKSLKKSIDNLSEGKKLNAIEEIPAKASEVIGRNPFPADVLGAIEESRVNPWALDAAFKLLDNRIEKQAVKTSLGVYKQTIDALRGQPEGLTAKEVADKTGRFRNTESNYLNRLSRAELVEKKKKGRKTVFKIGSEEDLTQVFGKIN